MATAKVTADGHVEVQVVANGQTMQLSKADVAEILPTLTEFAPAPPPKAEKPAK